MYSTRAVVVGELNVSVQDIPFALPAPDSTTVHAAAIGNNIRGYAVADEQLHGNCSRLRKVRVGRISHGRLLSVRCNGLNSVGRLPFLDQWVLQRW